MIKRRTKFMTSNRILHSILNNIFAYFFVVSNKCVQFEKHFPYHTNTSDNVCLPVAIFKKKQHTWFPFHFQPFALQIRLTNDLINSTVQITIEFLLIVSPTHVQLVYYLILRISLMMHTNNKSTHETNNITYNAPDGD